MIKYIPLLSLFFVFLLVKNEAYTQDLIERTQLGIKQPPTTAKNQLAKLVAQNKQSAARFNEFAPFEVSKTANSLLEGYALGSINLTVKAEQLAHFIRTQPDVTTLKIPVNEKSFFELDIYKVDIFSQDFIFRSSEGEDLTTMNNGVFYRGIVKGDNNSIVSVSIFGTEIRIMISDDDGNYVIGKLKNENAHVLYNDRNLTLDQPETCVVGDNQKLIKDGFRQQVETKARNNMAKCIPIYVECDFDMYQKHNNSEASVIAFVSALINEVATIYANEQIEISLSDLKVWTTTDPYASLNNTNAVLQKFGELTKNNYNGRLAHFISTRALGGGIAWIDVLCSSYFTFSGQHAGPYAVSANMGTSITTFPTYSWNIQVFAHEMGHNMGSQHTQNCSWNGNNTAIDACSPTEGGCASTYGDCPPGGGTIMSYCNATNCGIDFNNGFGQQPGELIRNRYNNATCTLSCAAPTCDDGVQNGDETGIDCGGSNCNTCPCYANDINLSLTFDNYPQETSWTITNSTGNILYSGSGYTQAGVTITPSFTLPPAAGYTFTINDAYSDGICCGYGNGVFSLTDNNGVIIATGGAFDALYSVTFCTENNGGPLDNCPNDPNKITPGLCGCGTPDTDSDNDGTPNCNDACPNDANKIAAGDCGCGIPDTDSDNDGTPNCNDACPNDANKIAAGDCGCGTPDTDSDNDGTPNCNDACPNDANKIAAGDCGCGMVDEDLNNNGTSDCLEASLCPEDRSVSANLMEGTEMYAQKTIATSGTLTITGNMVFKAGNTILLNPGFHAKAGSNFSAIIQTCSPTSGSFQDEATSQSLERVEGHSSLKSIQLKTSLTVMPNPFRSETTIQYQLAQTEQVLIQVMDVNGRLVKVLENQTTKTAGMNEVTFSGTTLDGGMYFVFLITPTKVLSQKIILIK